ncbi:hypothetical protein M2281_004957 [Mesorhizobium soli]|uniref:DUF1176 domain-containing protein n=1 Tax=Pseudaminobacter soli (ex Li et al. 2025) TaxID=1295366 RepID=UPI002475128D|nr:DUF1176 domain-containing protein [Mesorhizobium soli]MDH6234339.1 hypothetical protein [Mesorhizobium soli]
MRLLLVTALLCFCGLSAASAGSYKQIKDFDVSCSVALTCRIQTSAKSPAQPAANAFTLSRKAGPETPLDVLVAAPEPLAAGSDIGFVADGKEVLVLPLAKASRNDETGEYGFAGGAETMKLLDALRNASKLEITYKSGAGEGRSTFSLSGLVGALMFTDEAQGRLKAKDALQVTGEGTSPTIDVREISSMADVPEAIRGRFKDSGSCSFYDESQFGDGGFDAAVGEDLRLLALPCGDPGAYNQPFAVFIDRGGEIDRLALPDMSDEGPTTVWQAWNIDWDQSAKVMTAFFKGRGLGDCGSWNKWKLRTEGDGPAFVLLEARSKGECDGEYGGGPEKWPALWPLHAK